MDKGDEGAFDFRHTAGEHATQSDSMKTDWVLCKALKAHMEPIPHGYCKKCTIGR